MVISISTSFACYTEGEASSSFVRPLDQKVVPRYMYTTTSVQGAIPLCDNYSNSSCPNNKLLRGNVPSGSSL